MAYKIWTITKEVLFILLVLFVLLVVTVTILSHIPKSNTPFDVSLNLIKVEDPGEPVGTVAVTIDGVCRKYLFQEYSREPDKIKLQISGLDGYTDLTSIETGSDFGKIINDTRDGLLRTHYYANKDGRRYSVYITFTQDFNYWLISVSQWDAFYRETQMMAYYLGSTDKNATLDEITKIFAPFDYTLTWRDDISKPEIDSKPVTEITHIDWDMHGTFLNTDGTTRPVDFLVTGTITTTKEAPNHNLKLQIYLPDDFTYRMVCPTTGFSSWNQQNHEMVDLYICQGNAVNKDAPPTKTTIFSYFALDVEKEYFILMFQDAPGCHLVASTGETSRQALLTYFQNFTQTYSSYIWRD